MRKKALSLALALILCLCLAAPALAADSDFYIINGILVKYNGSGGDVVIPDDITIIGFQAFSDCDSLTSVTIPSSVTRIGSEVFGGCDNLTAIHVAANNQYFCSINGVLFSKDMKTLIAYPGVKQGTYSIPDSVTAIGGGAFSGCYHLTGVTIPDSVTIIGDAAFLECDSLTSVTIPNGVTSIGEDAFRYCRKLTSVSVPGSVTSIGVGAFAHTPWEAGLGDNPTINGILFGFNASGGDVVIPDGVTGIAAGLFFSYDPMTSVTIPNSVASIGDGAFSSCNGLTDVYYGGSEAQWKKIKFGDNNSDLLNAAIHYSDTAPAKSETAMPTNDQLTVNGKLQNPTVYKIGGSNFFKIRDLAAMLNGTQKQFDVGYDGALASVTLTTGKGYAKLDTDLAGAAAGGSQTADPSNDTIYINGQKIDVTVYKINGSNYFKLRDLGKALGFYVGWTAEDGVFIDTSKPYSE